MREVFGVLERIAATDLTVLIGGETGSGKDVIARAIHKASPRAKGPFVVFDCAAVAPNLDRVASCSATSRARSPAPTPIAKARSSARTAARCSSTRSASCRSSCSRSCCARSSSARVKAVGGQKEIPVDVRIIAATHRNLEQEVKEGAFRQDLFFRLSVVTVQVPPLRQRAEDLPVLVESAPGRRSASRSASRPRR